MLDSFFSRRIHWFFLVFAFFCTLFFKFFFLILVSAAYFFFLFLFRRIKISFAQKTAPTAPIGGRVIKIQNNVVTIRMTLTSGFGCYLPCDGEVVEKNRFSFLLKDSEGADWFFEFFPGIWGYSPQLFVLAGDKGRAGGNIGFIPWGGALILYLPENCEILVKENDVIEAGQTAFAKKRATHE